MARHQLYPTAGVGSGIPLDPAVFDVRWRHFQLELSFEQQVQVLSVPIDSGVLQVLGYILAVTAIAQVDCVCVICRVSNLLL